MRTRKILLVEDNPDTADSLALLLESFGHIVTVAHTGPAGLAAATESPPDIVISDIGLPGMDGYELGRLLRDLLGEKCLLIAATAFGQPEDIQRSAEAGFDAHFVKPVPLVYFLQLIDEI